MIVVIVPSYNDWQFLELLFESLYSEIAGHPFRVVVVDDHSNDGTEQKIRQLQGYADVIRPSEKAYFTRSCNAGLDWAARHTDAESFFLLNSDTVITPGWGAALVATSLKLEAGIVGATLLLPDGRIQHAGGYGVGYHHDINKPWLRYHKDRLVPWVTGAAMFIKRKTLELTGLLPVGNGNTNHQRQYDSSDRDFCINATHLHGVNVAVSADCVIYHDTHSAENIRRKRGDY